MVKEKKKDIKKIKEEVNSKHIEFYNKALDTVSFIMDEFNRDLLRADIEFLEIPKNSISTLDPAEAARYTPRHEQLCADSRRRQRHAILAALSQRQAQAASRFIRQRYHAAPGYRPREGVGTR